MEFIDSKLLYASLRFECIVVKLLKLKIAVSRCEEADFEVDVDVRLLAYKICLKHKRLPINLLLTIVATISLRISSTVLASVWHTLAMADMFNPCRLLRLN